mmetsp:Transcript_4740/g.10929  ORF Transcript_4740/g.10929 Transcript_4740/m.10929 type:complete len:208 (-) Transcript_4740:8-631(-)
MSPLFIVPSGNHPARPPASMCASSSCIISAMRSLSTSNFPDSVDLKGTAIWPMARLIVPRKGILRRCEETNILILPIFDNGIKVTSSTVSMKEAWFATITGERPDWPRADRKAASPSTLVRTQQLRSSAARQARQVLTRTARRRQELDVKGLMLAVMTLNFAIKNGGTVNRTTRRLKQKTAMPSNKPITGQSHQEVAPSVRKLRAGP